MNSKYFPFIFKFLFVLLETLQPQEPNPSWVSTYSTNEHDSDSYFDFEARFNSDLYFDSDLHVGSDFDVSFSFLILTFLSGSKLTKHLDADPKEVVMKGRLLRTPETEAHAMSHTFCSTHMLKSP